MNSSNNANARNSSAKVMAGETDYRASNDELEIVDRAFQAVTLIDTSAWIEFFRPKGDPHVKALVRDLVAIKQAAYTCPVAFELVTGASQGRDG